MTSKLGLHWMRVHPDGRDLAHIEAMQYPSMKLFEWHWSDADACANLLTVLPRDAYILARDHPLSEQKEDMKRDPVGTGTRHANEWADKVKSGRYKLPTDRTFFLGINEPDATTGDRDGIDRYTATYLEQLQAHGLRGGAFNFSTGHPRTVDGTGNTQADYSVFERSHRAIVSGHHIGVLHIYGTASVPCVPGHFDRLKACKWQDVEWVVGECGADEHVVGGGQHDGYLISMASNPAAYCDWLDQLIIGINDPRIHSYQVFTYDYSHPWSSFNTREIRDALESHQWRHTMQSTPTTPTQPPPEPVYPPFDPTTDENWFEKPKRGYVTNDNVNVRSGPGLDYAIVDTMQQGDPVVADVEVERTGFNWVRVANDGWMADKFIMWEGPTPVPQPSDNWSRARAYVKKWEGGFQDHDWDAGNWTGCEVGKGVKKGTNRGISACAYPNLDIRAITEQQADDIFFRDYWQKSGADRLAWPLCLFVYNVAVNFHPDTAKAWLEQSKGNTLMYAALMLRGYRKSKAWPQAGNAWVDRSIDLLMEASKP